MEIEWHKWFNMKTIYYQQELSLTLSQRWPTFFLAHTVSDMDKCIIKNQQMIALLLRLVGHKSNISAQLMHGRRCSMKHYKECPKNICRIRSIHHHCKMICITNMSLHFNISYNFISRQDWNFFQHFFFSIELCAPLIWARWNTQYFFLYVIYNLTFSYENDQRW